ncbi:hypothetical protein B0H13DRAFT_2110905 [Mycena leptocephala]|nr:hypothetical protein B0H13DRAFT_2110905 [Mycena leptocephala]
MTAKGSYWRNIREDHWARQTFFSTVLYFSGWCLPATCTSYYLKLHFIVFWFTLGHGVSGLGLLLLSGFGDPCESIHNQLITTRDDDETRFPPLTY